MGQARGAASDPIKLMFYCPYFPRVIGSVISYLTQPNVSLLTETNQVTWWSLVLLALLSVFESWAP